MIGILIVDDNVRLREAVRSELEAQEHLCIVGEAADGVAAVQLAQCLRPEVVLMDVNMARLDGVAATRSIRTLLPNTVLVGMSCHSREMVEKAMLSAGADVCLPKDTLGDDSCLRWRRCSRGARRERPRSGHSTRSMKGNL